MRSQEERKAIGRVLQGIKPGMVVASTKACAHPSNVPYPPGVPYRVVSIRSANGGGNRIKGVEIIAESDYRDGKPGTRRPWVADIYGNALKTHWLDRHTFWLYQFVVVSDNPLRREAQLARIAAARQK